MSGTRRFLGLLLGAVLAVGALFGTAAPAQAYSPNPGLSKYYYDTDSCPCSGGNLTDPFDGTYFSYDAGGLAVKMEMSDAGWFIGKVEFHPYDEKLWVYDTKNDGDTFVVSVSYTSGGSYHYVGTFQAPGTSQTVDVTVANLDIPEGAYVDISVYDDAERSDLIGAARGTGAAIA
ncbi:hypothetical protein J7F01_11430 [Streptomyces sp. ISL-22]|uniref:hypothetical protein n=1 Tax=unclassified Streptomyces TaxID=2593676 RepID=UPI001BEB7529|nr:MULTISPECIES: hypothetical protein [unclassified Streptomyces]MBT2421148.1 hypothetical protein [Streptomyces sp. ISL-24]MBT2432791.1 hypothetical protein [Streptomyces sp. ISL-22]